IQRELLIIVAIAPCQAIHIDWLSDHRELPGLESRGWHNCFVRQGCNEPLSLVIDEPESPILDNRSARRCPEIISHIGVLRSAARRIEEISGPERVISSKPVRTPVQFVCSASCQNL